jgi:hypothetical protein
MGCERRTISELSLSLGKEIERQDGPRGEGSEEHTSRRGRRPKLAAAQSITWNRAKPPASRLACAAPTCVNSIFLFISTIGSERCAHMQLACGSLGSWSAGPSSWPFAGPDMGDRGGTRAAAVLLQEGVRRWTWRDVRKEHVPSTFTYADSASRFQIAIGCMP